MKFKKIAVLTELNHWFVPYGKKLVKELRIKNFISKLFFNYGDIPSDYEVVFILSFLKLIKEEELKKHKHNIVVHESDLPKGRGWAPVFWQILEGENKIPVTLFEVNGGFDCGPFYLKDHFELRGDELYDEIRALQAEKKINLCLEFLERYDFMKLTEQVGEATFYKKRTFKDSELDINKSIKEHFNLMRIAHNADFPLFFVIKGQKYILKIYKDVKN